MTTATYTKTAHIIVGPTAVGKTARAIELARSLGTEIISADSRQCYRELNIGVARPSPGELAAVPHHFIATHSILDNLSAADFEQYALQKAQEIFQSHDHLVMVGGTGLYIKAFTDGLDPVPPSDPGLRATIVSEYQTKGISWLQAAIRELDPEFYHSGEMQNPQRLMRALEVIQISGRSIRSFQTGNRKLRSFNIRIIGLDMPRPQLIERINDRVNGMMAAGQLAEVKQLIQDFSLTPGKVPAALQTVGYTELIDFCFGTYTLDEAIEQIKINTRRYAKRQLTWFRKIPEISWQPA